MAAFITSFFRSHEGLTTPEPPPPPALSTIGKIFQGLQSGITAAQQIKAELTRPPEIPKITTAPALKSAEFMDFFKAGGEQEEPGTPTATGGRGVGMFLIIAAVGLAIFAIRRGR